VSFCLRQQRGEFDLSGRDALWRLLVTITLRKARNAAKKQARDRRDITREQTIADRDDGESAHWALEQMDAAGPSPAEAAVLNEALERRLEVLADPELRQIALWRLEGHTNREIADRLDCTERSVITAWAITTRPATGWSGSGVTGRTRPRPHAGRKTPTPSGRTWNSSYSGRRPRLPSCTIRSSQATRSRLR
jgi:hypothetical protein